MKRKTNILLVLLFSLILSGAFFVSKSNAAFSTGDVTTCFFPVAGSVQDINSTGIMCNTSNGGELLFKRYWAYTSKGTNSQNIGVTQYTANDIGYDSVNKTGDYYIISVVDGSNTAYISKIRDQGTTASYIYANKSFSVTGTNPITNVDPFAAGFRSLVFGKDCPSATAISCWLSEVYSFAQTAVLLLSTGSLVVAGIFYMTSAGDPKRMDFAKRLITGSLSAVAVIVLGRFFLTRVIGVPWL